MDFRTELAKRGYNKGNSVDVEILINEILPELFSKQETLEDELWGNVFAKIKQYGLNNEVLTILKQKFNISKR